MVREMVMVVLRVNVHLFDLSNVRRARKKDAIANIVRSVEKEGINVKIVKRRRETSSHWSGRG